MHDAPAMRVVQRRGDLRTYRRRRAGGDRTLLHEHIRQRPAREIRHHDEDRFRRLGVVDDRADVRVYELARRLGFAAESLPHFRVAREVRVQDLDHERSLEQLMLGVVDVRHAAAAQPPNHAIPAPR